jgi:hypothetical protein
LGTKSIPSARRGFFYNFSWHAFGWLSLLTEI